MATFGERLKEAALKKGFCHESKQGLARIGEVDQTALAAACGLTHSTISNLLAAKRRPAFATLEKLAAGLGVYMIELLEDSTDG